MIGNDVEVWEWKGTLTTWDYCFPSYFVSKLGFNRWYEQDERIDYVTVRRTKYFTRNAGRFKVGIPPADLLCIWQAKNV